MEGWSRLNRFALSGILDTTMFSGKNILTFLVFFALLLIFIYVGNKNAYFTIMSTYKRQFRELDDSTKQKISKASKGKTKSMSHREHLSNALKKYWDSVPSRSKDLSMQEYLQGENNSSVKPSNQNAE